MPFSGHEGGVKIAIRLRPGASANRIDGAKDFANGTRRLCVRVTAVPEKGKANDALIKLLAKSWRIPRSRLSIIAGAKDRNKTLLFADADAADLKFLTQSLD
jgi:uncharacterized protein (TIGR00251 family)